MKLVDYVRHALGSFHVGDPRGKCGRPYLSDQQKAILARLAKNPAYSSEIARDIGASRSLVSVKLSKLKTKGLVKMTPGEANGSTGRPPCIWELVEGKDETREMGGMVRE